MLDIAAFVCYDVYTMRDEVLDMTQLEFGN